MKLFSIINILKIINKIAYIGLGMGLAAMLDYGISRDTTLAVILGICLAISTRIAINEEIKLYDETI